MKSLPNKSTRVQHKRTATDLLSRFSEKRESKKVGSDVYERAKWKAKFLFEATVEDSKNMHTPFSDNRKYSTYTDDSDTQSTTEENTLTTSPVPKEIHTSPTNQSSLQSLILPNTNKRTRRPRKRDNCKDLASLVKDCKFSCN
eukprot:TRINITY_DN0_c231_g1_i7.p2 TRINITY_DN0_c231_g1~~TRINITY_DN0_c231_g1_i7.p2  ORF type:complete len:152 (-),score=22.19 TRINITY_DN0_c231_g1_i7:58-486(-)